MPSGLFGNQWNTRTVIHCEGLCWALQGIWQFRSLPTKCQYVSPQSLRKPNVPHHSSLLPDGAVPTRQRATPVRTAILYVPRPVCFCLSPLLKVHRETKPHRNPKVTHEAPSLAMCLLRPLRSTHGFYTLVIVSPRLCSKSSNCSSVSSVTKKKLRVLFFHFHLCILEAWPRAWHWVSVAGWWNEWCLVPNYSAFPKEVIKENSKTDNWS